VFVYRVIGMQKAFIILQPIVFFILAAAIPFWFALRGGSLIKAFGMCWGMIIFVFLFYMLLVPLILGFFDPQLGKEVLLHWAPEMTGMTVALLFGWLPALVLVAAAGLHALLFA